MMQCSKYSIRGKGFRVTNINENKLLGVLTLFSLFSRIKMTGNQPSAAYGTLLVSLRLLLQGSLLLW